MAMYFSSLNSGSNGNVYYAGTRENAIIIDAGISCREIEKRLLRSNLDIKKIRAVFISHEHSDHIRGLEVFSRKNNIQVYISEKTYSQCGFKIDASRLNFFEGEQSIAFGDITVNTFRKIHDAIDPYSFSISSGNFSIAVMTDIGKVCDKVKQVFANANAVFLEANYDAEMLQNGPYPYYLKKRISGGEGHLSNFEAVSLFTQYRSDKLSHLILAHLSRENNSPSLVENLFKQHNLNSHIHVASRYYESEVFSLGIADQHLEEAPRPQIKLELF